MPSPFGKTPSSSRSSAELQARGIDFTDKDAVEDVIRQINAENIARRALNPPL
ncbi:hypothetical protein [Dactylosporangium sp. NPDC005555]|uniref:hypothetical protein n=1 Tax=Dactylosporangium sp. NPDC005555 TaxID=3154889 RepID=UPI0033B10287